MSEQTDEEKGITAIMSTLNDDIKEYTGQLRRGAIPRAYRGIIGFMSALMRHMSGKYPEYTASALYAGFMDMTYFAFTPGDLRSRNLKIAVVYLHEENRMEVWLGGGNRKIQADYIAKLGRTDIGDYILSEVKPGVDSIIEKKIARQPDFDHADELTRQIEEATIIFANDMIAMLEVLPS